MKESLKNTEGEYLVRIKKNTTGVVKTLFWFFALFSLFILIESFRALRFSFLSLSNAFTDVGAVFVGIGGMSYISFRGGYDSFLYAFRLYPFPRLFGSSAPAEYGSFYEYKTEKDKARRCLSPFVLFLGALSLFLGAVFALLS